MNRSRVIKLKGSSVLENFTKCRGVLILSLFFLLGLIIGCAFFDRFYSLGESVYLNFINVRKNSGFIKILFCSLWYSLPFQLIAFVFGTSVMGTVLSPITVIAKGINCGLLCSYIYATQKISGIAFCGLIIILPTVISVIALIFTVKKAVEFSSVLVMSVLPSGQAVYLSREFKEYVLKNLFYFALLAVSSVVDAVCTCLFLGIFKL